MLQLYMILFINGDGRHETTINVVSWNSVLLLVGAMEG